jgi:hypothetical protein
MVKVSNFSESVLGIIIIIIIDDDKMMMMMMMILTAVMVAVCRDQSFHGSVFRILD